MGHISRARHRARPLCAGGVLGPALLMVRVLAWPTVAVNVVCMVLAAYTNDLQVFLIALIGAVFAVNAWLYYVQESRAMSKPRSFQQVATQLRYEILQAAPPAGYRLDTLIDLAHRFKTTRTTMSRALAVLQDEGILERVQGRGTYIIGPDGHRGYRNDFPREIIYNRLRDMMLAAPAGTALPPVQDVMDEHRVSAMTVRRAQYRLMNEGVLTRTPTGEYVKA